MERRKIIKICVIVGAVVTVIISISGILLYGYSQSEQSKKRDAITNCFNISEYSSINPTFTTKEPIERYFKLCMEFNGYNPDEFSFSE